MDFAFQSYLFRTVYVAHQETTLLPIQTFHTGTNAHILIKAKARHKCTHYACTDIALAAIVVAVLLTFCSVLQQEQVECLPADNVALCINNMSFIIVRLQEMGL